MAVIYGTTHSKCTNVHISNIYHCDILLKIKVIFSSILHFVVLLYKTQKVQCQECVVVKHWSHYVLCMYTACTVVSRGQIRPKTLTFFQRLENVTQLFTQEETNKVHRHKNKGAYQWGRRLEGWNSPAACLAGWRGVTRQVWFCTWWTGRTACLFRTVPVALTGAA
jgi:hypothetical protein